MANKINIPNKKDKFENVPFVHDMTPYQLKVMIKNFVENIQELANVCDDVHPDVSRVLDKIFDKKLWNPKDIDQKDIYIPYNEYTLRFNLKTKKMAILNENYDVIEVLQGKTIQEMKLEQKKIKQLTNKRI